MRFDPATTVPMFFDLATSTGWATRALGGKIAWGSFAMTERGLGAFLDEFERFAVALIHGFKPTIICYEAPFVGPKTSQAVAAKLFGLKGHMEYVAFRNGRLPCFEELRPDILKFWLGRLPGGRDEQKAAMIRMAGVYGFAPIANDDEADALGGLALSCHRLKLPTAASQGPLFKPEGNPNV